jgi:orotidine-5'-phosphate decarboxylase
LALDFDRLEDALTLARAVSGVVGMFKVNTHLFTAAGPEAVERLSALGAEVFLDLKFHDIPNTVAGAVGAAARLPGVRLIDLHATGGPAMMKAGAESLARTTHSSTDRPRLLGITILTSLDQSTMKRVGITGTPGSRAVSLARLAKESKLDGVVASPQEVRQIRRACGPEFLIVVPGIRPESTGGLAKSDDQARFATPAEAVRAGADYLVVGRPITAAPDPVAAAQRIVEEMTAAMRAV